MRRDAARSAGPREKPCMRGLAAAISSTFATPSAVSRIAWIRIGRFEPALRLELREQPIDVVDVPGAFDLRDHDHVELVADLADDGRQVVEEPGAVEAVHPRPELGRPKSVSRAIFTSPSRAATLFSTSIASSRFASRMSHLLGDLRHLRRHARIARVEEVDHPRGAEGNLAQRLGRADAERLGEVSRVAHGRAPAVRGDESSSPRRAGRSAGGRPFGSVFPWPHRSARRAKRWTCGCWSSTTTRTSASR